jgi:hypothetical protein
VPESVPIPFDSAGFSGFSAACAFIDPKYCLVGVTGLDVATLVNDGHLVVHT